MKNYIIIAFLLLTLNTFANEISVVTLAGDTVVLTLVSESETKHIISKFNGKKQNSLRKEWTARTFKLANEKLLIEFYDGSSILVKDSIEFQNLKNVRFVKNYINQLKRNVSYKIEIDNNTAVALKKLKGVKHLLQYKPEIPEYLDYKVYQLPSGQILYMESTKSKVYAAVYENIKTLASERSEIEAQEYILHDDEYFMKELSLGNRFLDYEPNQHLVYPKYLDAIIASHQLELKESKVYISDFQANLYLSELGYWVLIDEVHQPNRSGLPISILDLVIFEDLDDVREAQKQYERTKGTEVRIEDMYRQISEKYGVDFPQHVDSLISLIPTLLNIDEEHLSIDEQGIQIIDEAIHWNHNNFDKFETWFPSILAYYGEYYIRSKHIGKWEVEIDKDSNVWIPQITCDDKSAAFDSRAFYTSLLEWPLPLKEAGDYDGKIKLMRQKIRNRR